MKRPLAVTGLTGLCAQCLLMMVRPSFSLFFSMVLLAAAGVCIWIPQTRKKTVCWVMLLTAGVVGVLTSAVQLHYEPLRTLDGKTAVIQGQVTAIQREENYVSLTVEADAIINQRTDALEAQNVRLILYTYELTGVNPYDYVEIELVELEAPKDGLWASERSQYAAQDVYLTGSFLPANCVAASGKAPWYSIFDRARAQMRRALDIMLPEELSSLLSAMVLGDRSRLDDAVTAQFRYSGLGAVLVVSGLHLTLLIGTLLLLLRKVLGSYRLSAAICMPLVILFILFTGAGGSVIRAGVSMLIWLAGIILMRNADPLNSLGAAALVLLCLRPCIGGDVGVQLSFLAAAGIFTLGKELNKSFCARLPEKWQRGWVKSLSGGAAASIGATVFTMPVVVLTFGYVPLLGVLTNLLASLPTEVILLAGMAAAGFGALGWLALAYPCGWIAGQAGRLLLKIAEIFSDGPLVRDQNGFLSVWTAVVMAVFGLLLLIPARRRVLWIAGLLSAVVLVAGSVERTTETGYAWIRVVDCGDGIAVQISRNEKTVTLLAGGRISETDDAALYLTGHDAGDVYMLDAGCDEQAAAILKLIPENRIRSLRLAGTFLPDALKMDSPAYPIRYGLGTAFAAGEGIVLHYYGDASGCWCVAIEDYEILIPMAGANLKELTEIQRKADLVILAFDDIQDVFRSVSKNYVFSCNEDTAKRLYDPLSNFYGNYYFTAQLGTTEFYVDEYGRLDAVCP